MHPNTAKSFAFCLAAGKYVWRIASPQLVVFYCPIFAYKVIFTLTRWWYVWPFSCRHTSWSGSQRPIRKTRTIVALIAYHRSIDSNCCIGRRTRNARNGRTCYNWVNCIDKFSDEWRFNNNLAKFNIFSILPHTNILAELCPNFFKINRGRVPRLATQNICHRISNNKLHRPHLSSDWVTNLDTFWSMCKQYG